MARVAIIGSRAFPDLAAVAEYVQTLPADTVVVSGGARGVDSVAEAAARKRGLTVDIYYADWDEHGRRAGYLRNIEVMENSDCAVAFWDGSSPGTAMAVQLFKDAGKPVMVKHPRPNAPKYQPSTEYPF